MGSQGLLEVGERSLWGQRGEEGSGVLWGCE